MAYVAENYFKFYVRAVVRLLQAEGVIQSEIRRRSLSVHGQKVVSRKEVSVWREQI
jgi:ribosomal protein S19E (S16A)